MPNGASCQREALEDDVIPYRDACGAAESAIEVGAAESKSGLQRLHVGDGGGIIIDKINDATYQRGFFRRGIGYMLDIGGSAQLIEDGRQIRQYTVSNGLGGDGFVRDVQEHVPYTVKGGGVGEAIALAERSSTEGCQKGNTTIGISGRHGQYGRREMQSQTLIGAVRTDMELVRFSVTHDENTPRCERVVMALYGVVALSGQKAVDFATGMGMHGKCRFLGRYGQGMVQIEIRILVQHESLLSG